MQYEVQPASLAPGLYRQITGNQALAYGLIAASAKSELLPRRVPDHAGVGDPRGARAPRNSACGRSRQRTRSPRSAPRSASFGGVLGVCTSASPGVVLKAETVGLGVTLELPLVIIDVQRAGPSTGMPTKPEQADLLMVLYELEPGAGGRGHGDCFECALGPCGSP